MLTGIRTASNPETPNERHRHTAVPATSFTPPKHVLVIGGGIAGCASAHALARRGVHVTLVERGEFGCGASGNPAAVLFPQTPKWASEAARFYFAGFDFSTRQIAALAASGFTLRHNNRGMLRLPRSTEEEAVLLRSVQHWRADTNFARWCSAAEVSKLAGITLNTGGIFFPRGGWVSPPDYLAALRTHPRITCHTNTRINALTRTGSGWEGVATKDGQEITFYADWVILANAHAAADLLNQPLPMGRVAGQISLLDVPERAELPKTVLCQRGYAVAYEGGLLVGATYERNRSAVEISEASHTENLAHLAAFAPHLAAAACVTGGRVSTRTTTPDRLPYIGRVEAGISVSLGHGSRGFISAPIGGEILASSLLRLPPPLEGDLLARLDPARVRIDDHTRPEA